MRCYRRSACGERPETAWEGVWRPGCRYRRTVAGLCVAVPVRDMGGFLPGGCGSGCPRCRQGDRRNGRSVYSGRRGIGTFDRLNETATTLKRGIFARRGGSAPGADQVLHRPGSCGT
jgi:hypothetical protein